MGNGTIYDGSSYQAWSGDMNIEHEFGGVLSTRVLTTQFVEAETLVKGRTACLIVLVNYRL